MSSNPTRTGERESSPPSADDPSQVLLLMAHTENRRRLAAWLRENSRYRPVVGTEDVDATGDLCLVDPEGLTVHADRIRSLKTADERFYPVLLAHGNEQPPTSEAIWDVIDETIRTPVFLPEFRRRLENLLERRALSANLAAELEATENRYRSLFDGVNDAILVIDPETDRVLECNPRATDLLGYSQAELQSLSPCHDLHAQNTASFEAFLADVRDRGRSRTETLVYERKNGDRIEAEVSASIVEGDDGTQVILSIRDVTARHEHERRLERQRARLDELNRITRTLHETVQAVVQSNDQESLEEDVCRRLSESDVYQLAWIGGCEDDVIQPRAAGEGAWEYLTEPSVAGAFCATHDGPTARALETRSVCVVRDISESSTLLPWKEGLAEFDVRATAAVPIQDGDRLFGVLNLYTGRQNAFSEDEQAILEDLGRTIGREITGIEAREEAELFQEAVARAGSAVSILDADGTVEYVNEAFEELTGYSSAELTGDRLQRLLSDESDVALQSVRRRVLEGDTWEGELEIRTRDGQRRYVEQTLAPIQGFGDGRERLIAVGADLTESRRQRQQLEVLFRVLRHNFRNQLNIIKGYGDILRAAETDADRDAAAATVTQTVDDLLTISDQTQRIERTFTTEDTQETAPFTEVVRSACRRILSENPTAEASVTVPDIDGRVNPELGTAVRELTRNAITHTDAESPSVDVRVEVVQRTPFPEATIRIADTGRGIPDDERAVLREGEETPLLHGSGLGLWLVHWIVTELGGRIDITDNDPQGSIVTLTIPLRTPDS